MAAALLGTFLMTLDALIVNVALPAIGHGLGGGITGLQWVVDGYTLMFAALLLSAGSVADKVGARRAFGAGLAVFVAASAICGLAPNLAVLVAARLVQGAGAAVIVPASLALIREAFPDSARRTRAVSVWAMAGSAGAAAGPVAGGLLSQADWRLIFFVNVPVGLAALLLLARTARSPRRPAPFDWTGQIAAIVAIGALTYAAIEAGAAGFGQPRVLAAFALAVVAGPVFLVSQTRGAHPMVPPELLRSRTMRVAAAAGFAINVGFYGVIFLFSLYLQQSRGLSALAAGLTFVPMTVLTAFISRASAWLALKCGPRVPVVTGLLVMSTGLAVLSLSPVSVPVWALVALIVPVGAGGSLALPSVTAVLLDRVPAERAGTASGVLNASRQLGGGLAVAAFGALVAHAGSFHEGLRTSLLTAAFLILPATAASLLLRPGTRS
ncbi:MFS transporter [Streptomyces fuscichromogenes]|uniref:MFS transporter n=1 Tax=Streptomyces fuscichromogenes TaxID=1324013 RepID=UPI003802BF9C